MREIALYGGEGNANQRFSLTLNGVNVTFVLQYLSYIESEGWNLDIYDESEKPLVFGLMLRCNTDLLAPYHLNLGHLVMLGEDPNFENLGVENHLYWSE